MNDDQLVNLANEISQSPPIDPDTEEPIEAMLTKYVVIAEWMDGTGSKYLVRRSATGQGEGIAHWDLKGLLVEGLLGQW